jgi:hypothetical protein
MNTVIAASSYARSLQSDVQPIDNSDPQTSATSYRPPTSAHDEHPAPTAVPVSLPNEDEDRYLAFSSSYGDDNEDSESSAGEGIDCRGSIDEGNSKDGKAMSTGERRGQQTRIAAGPPRTVEKILQDIGVCRSFQVELLEGTIPPENRAGRWGLANNYNNHE